MTDDACRYVFLALIAVVVLASPLCSGCVSVHGAQCDTSFAAALDAWEAASGKAVPAGCRELGAEYAVEVIEHSVSVPCSAEPLASDGTLHGCLDPLERTMQVRQDAAHHMLGAQVHLWMHALSDCALGDFDRAHLRAGVWAGYGVQSAERQAYAKAERDRCEP